MTRVRESRHARRMRHARMGLGALALLVAVWILTGAFIVAVG